MKYKPYPKYKDSGVEWLGEIPEGWEIEKFKYLCCLSDERNGSVPYGDMLSVSGYRGIEVRDYEHEEQKRDDEDLETYRVVHKGQLVVNTMWLNYAGLGVSLFEGHVSPAYKVYSIQKNVDLWYFHHFLRSDSSVEGYKKYLRGIRPNSLQMTTEDFGAFPILLPPLPVQRSIAAFLDAQISKIDDLIKENEELIALLKEKRQALISHAVTRGLSELVDKDDPDFGVWARPVRFKDSGVEWIGEIPEGWEVKKLGHVVEITAGYPFKAEEFSDEGVPVIRMSDFSEGRIILDDAKKINPSNIPEKVYAKSGDIILGLSGSYSNYAFIRNTDLPVVINQRVGILRNYKNVTRELVSWFIQSYVYIEQISSHLPETTILNISMYDLSKCKLAIPPRNEQTAIGKYLESKVARIEMLSSEAKDSVRLLQEHRSALITNAVTGKINVEGLG